MPLGTLDRTPPPFFRQGLSALSKLIVCSALAVFLMVADARLDIAHPLRIAVAGLLYPAQWLVLQPIGWSRAAIGYLQGLQTSQSAETRARAQLGMQSQRANQVEQLLLENACATCSRCASASPHRPRWPRCSTTRQIRSAVR